MREACIKIAGTPYRLTGLDARLSQEYLDYAVKNLPDPVDDVLNVANKLEGKAREDFLSRHLDKAFEAKKLRGSITDPDLEKFTQTTTGARKLFSLMFKKHHPHIADDDVYDLVLTAIEEHGEEVFKELYKASNKVPVSEGDAEAKYFRGNRKSRRVKV